MHALTLGALMLCALMLGAQTQPSPQEQDKQAERLLRAVDDHYNHLSSLRAHYTEHYSGAGLDRSESGTLLLKKPGRMLWRYESPAGKVFVLDPKYAWFYTPGDAQAQRISAKRIDDLRTPLRLLLGHMQLRKELEAVVVTPNAGGFRISGAPKGMQNRVRQLTLQVTPLGGITGMKLEEVDGATTDFVFSNLQENVPASDSSFIFTAPPGVTIVDGAPPV